jgi:hypothetical protein
MVFSAYCYAVVGFLGLAYVVVCVVVYFVEYAEFAADNALAVVSFHDFLSDN